MAPAVAAAEPELQPAAMAPMAALAAAVEPVRRPLGPDPVAMAETAVLAVVVEPAASAAKTARAGTVAALAEMRSAAAAAAELVLEVQFLQMEVPSLFGTVPFSAIHLRAGALVQARLPGFLAAERSSPVKLL
jgi:hypothetical protein